MSEQKLVPPDVLIETAWEDICNEIGDDYDLNKFEDQIANLIRKRAFMGHIIIIFTDYSSRFKKDDDSVLALGKFCKTNVGYLCRYFNLKLKDLGYNTKTSFEVDGDKKGYLQIFVSWSTP